MRVGLGYDVHRLVPDRALILGGVEIPYEKGLLGHSDADVLLHAIMDAMLGAAAMGDIGKHFPDTDPKYEGASSLELLKRVGELLEEELYVVENIDATIIAQKPKRILQRRWDWSWIRSISRRRRKRDLDLRGAEKAFLLRQSVLWKK